MEIKKIVHIDFREEYSSNWTRKVYSIQDKIPLSHSIGSVELQLADVFDSMVSKMLDIFS